MNVGRAFNQARHMFGEKGGCLRFSEWDAAAGRDFLKTLLALLPPLRLPQMQSSVFATGQRLKPHPLLRAGGAFTLLVFLNWELRTQNPLQ